MIAFVCISDIPKWTQVYVCVGGKSFKNLIYHELWIVLQKKNVCKMLHLPNDFDFELI